MKLDLDFNRTAHLVKLELVMRRWTQAEIAAKVGLDRVTFNRYLNRKLNLLPSQIAAILTELDLWHRAKQTGCIWESREERAAPSICTVEVDLDSRNMVRADDEIATALPAPGDGGSRHQPGHSLVGATLYQRPRS